MPELEPGALVNIVRNVELSVAAGMPLALEELARRVERRAKDNANTGTHRPGESHVPGTGPGPNLVTGNLWRNITHTRAAHDAEGWYVRVGTAFGATYGKYLETGLRNGVKYPFLLSAVDEITGRVAGIIRPLFRWR